jgi:hypothetical protein
MTFLLEDGNNILPLQWNSRAGSFPDLIIIDYYYKFEYLKYGHLELPT